MKGNFIRTIDLSSQRGQQKRCQICNKEFGMLNAEHQCKRCKRAVCDKCAQHKIIILNYSKSKDPHRVCNICKEESDSMRKFLLESNIQFDRDSLSIEWLQQFGIDLDMAKHQYKSNKSQEDQSEYNLFKGQLSLVYGEIEQFMNYSLRDFFALTLQKVDKNNVLSTIDRVVGTFLLNFPEVGYQPDLIFIGLFLLCFGSEASAYSMLCLLYTDILPNHLYFRSMRLSNYDFKNEISTIIKIFQVLVKNIQGLKMQTEPVKPFLQGVKNYIIPLTLNFFTFESSLFIFQNLFMEDGYNEMLKCLASAFTQQDYSLTNERIQMSILWNVRLAALQKVYYETKKFKTDGPIVRSMSVVQQRESDLKQEGDKMRNEMSNLQKQLQQGKLTIEALQQQINTQTKKITQLEQSFQEAKENELKLQDENSIIMEQNHNLKLQLLSSDNNNNNNNKDVSRLESTSRTLEASYSEQQKQDELMISQLQKDKIAQEQIILKLTQENELLKSEKQSSSNPSQMAMLVKMKNDQIAKLTQQLAEQQQQQQQQQLQQKNSQQQQQKSTQNHELIRSTSVVQMNSVIKDLEDGKNLIEKKNQEILKLKKQLSDLQSSQIVQNQRISLNRNSNEIIQQQQVRQEQMEVSEDMLLLLSDQDPQKRTAARNIKAQMQKLNEELIFQRTQAAIKKEQLEPFRNKAESLQKQLDFLVEQNKELQIEVEHKQDLIGELDKKPRKTLQPRTNLRDDKDILYENQNSYQYKKRLYNVLINIKQQMLQFNGEFNHAYNIIHTQKPKMLNRLLKINFIFLFFAWNQENAIIAILFNLIIYFISGKEIIKEQMVVIKNIGIQIEKTQRNGSTQKLFLNQNLIQDVIIQEGLTNFSVEVYLAIICHGMNKMVLPFQGLNQEELMRVYYPVRQMIKQL